jgi:hypothetical protein
MAAVRNINCAGTCVEKLQAYWTITIYVQEGVPSVRKDGTPQGSSNPPSEQTYSWHSLHTMRLSTEKVIESWVSSEEFFHTTLESHRYLMRGEYLLSVAHPTRTTVGKVFFTAGSKSRVIRNDKTSIVSLPIPILDEKDITSSR